MASTLSLSEQIREAFTYQETDGILQLAQSSSLLDHYSVEELVEATLEATSQKGQIASILNALIGSCCVSRNPAKSLELFDAFQDLEESHQIVPDLVTSCLVYSALMTGDNSTGTTQQFQGDAEEILDDAIRSSKKASGSKRRKALAATRRKPLITSVKDVELELQQLLGSPDVLVLDETEDYLVLNKPSGTSLYHRQTTTSGKIKKKKGKNKKKATESSDSSHSSDISLEDALLNFNIPLSTINSDCLGLVHRLDRGTSGTLILAKTDHMHALLVSEFFLRRTKKKYLTIVSPAPSEDTPEKGSIDLRVQGRPAKSLYRIVERYGDDFAKLEVEILTGRKHQIRVHCGIGLSAPILWDEAYGGAQPPVHHRQPDRFFLHASELSLPQYDVQIHAPTPSWWEEVISEQLVEK